ncbi:hypothetical protein KP509_04G022100 [Ceratopteris richardii]|uniref:Glycosyltransferase n=1 Tax=Ceratopteris richardii TaxID=49495 RepID=A0A8T2UV13_CERRI|nr:hypothetical protein KP509_04G022100 [Ceratopteris richardii]
MIDQEFQNARTIRALKHLSQSADMASDANCSKAYAHVVAIPYPAQGHLSPMLQICRRLSAYGFSFTFVNTANVHWRMAQQQKGCRNSSVQSKTANEIEVHSSPTVLGSSNGYRDDFCQQDFASDNRCGVPAERTHACLDDLDSPIGFVDAKSDAIHMVYVDGGCPPEGHARKSTMMEVVTAAQDIRCEVEQLLPSIIKKQPVAFLLTDMMFGWSNSVAKKFDLPWVCFWPGSAASGAVIQYCVDLMKQGKEYIPIAVTENGEVPVVDVFPGLPPTRLHDIPGVCDSKGKLQKPILTVMADVQEASFLLLNTFMELETQALDALSVRCAVFAIGPLLPPIFLNENTPTHVAGTTANHDERIAHMPSLFREERTCLNWLDKQRPSTVLFISFGSISEREERQLQELANGVSASGCPFLWVRRSQDAIGTFVQEEEKGIVVSWAPQLEVLAHPAVGGFLTHCGWNSVVESLTMGVPMLCWADTGERLCNQRYVVEVWKCGLDMVSDGRRSAQHIDDQRQHHEQLISRHEIETSIRKLMGLQPHHAQEGAERRVRAARLRASARSAFHGSSLSAFRQFAETTSSRLFPDRRGNEGTARSQVFI